MSVAEGSRTLLEEERARSRRTAIERELREYYGTVTKANPRQAQLVRLLQQLEEDQRHLYLVVQRHIADDLGFDEIARVWKVSSKTVGEEFREAMNRLAEWDRPSG